VIKIIDATQQGKSAATAPVGQCRRLQATGGRGAVANVCSGFAVAAAALTHSEEGNGLIEERMCEPSHASLPPPWLCSFPRKMI
jgi:hypothetical protein